MNDDTVALLERELRDLAPHLQFAPTPDLASAVGARLRAQPEPVRRRTPGWLGWPRRLSLAPIAAGLVLVMALVLVVSPGARRAVADVLRGVPGIRVFVEERAEPRGAPGASAAPTPSVAPTAQGLLVPGDRISLADALSRSGLKLKVPRELGNPDVVYLDTSIRGGMLSAVWYADARLPETNQPRIGAVLTQFVPRHGEAFITKELFNTSARFRFVEVNGKDAGWVEGGHPFEVLLPDRAGNHVVVATRLAANTLMWVQDGVTMRLETALPLWRATEIAESVD